KGRFTISRD
nr:immunoglobulin heavy chain junction region [Mus musculus]